MEIAIAIPAINEQSMLEECIGNLRETCAASDLDVLVIDNASQPALEVPPATRVIRAEENLGMFRSLRVAAESTEADILAFLHYDLRMWTAGWDRLVESVFTRDPQIGLAGLVGAPGLHASGMRVGCCSRLIGRVLGGNGTNEVWRVHGGWTPDGGVYGAVLDGCGMFFRRQTVAELLDLGYPGLHHFYDLEVSCAWLAGGWRIFVLPIEADHGPGAAVGQEPYVESAKRRAEAVGIRDPAQVGAATYDQVMYGLNARHWSEKWAHRLPVAVSADGVARWAAPSAREPAR